MVVGGTSAQDKILIAGVDRSDESFGESVGDLNSGY